VRREISVSLRSVASTLEDLPSHGRGIVEQRDATAPQPDASVVASTHPPYYNTADLSDFFYVWLRRSLAAMYPDLFSTMLTPKAAELVATVRGRVRTGLLELA